jgi:ligand-binding sensor domain-containing protein/signal transduction histidine kinase
MMEGMGSARGRRTGILLFVSLLSAMLAPSAAAFERLQRKFDLERGLPFSEVFSVKQDTRGFIWITTGGGLFRYDGVELRSWPRGSFHPSVRSVATGPAGEVLLLDPRGHLLEVAEGAIQPVRADGVPLDARVAPVWDHQSTLWVLTQDRLIFRSPGSSWRAFPLSSIGSEKPNNLLLSEGGSAVLVTDRAIWSVEATPDARRLASIADVGKALVRADGSIVALRRDGRVVEIRRGAEREIFRKAARPIDMVQRGATIWVAYDSQLVALRAGEPPEILDSVDQVPSGGPLLVDQEGSLWLGTFRGLLQYPAPETVAWGSSDGMASNSPRRLASSPEGIWVDAWTGLTLLHRQGSSWRPERVPDTGSSAVCVGTDGAMWAGYRGRFLEHRGGDLIAHPRSDLTRLADCAPGAGGRVWLASESGLLFVAGGSGRTSREPVTVPAGERREGAVVRVIEDSAERLWLSEGEEICHADARALEAGRTASWSCTKATGSGMIFALAEIAPGDLWAATLEGGVYRLESQGRWEPIPGSRMLPTRLVRRIRPSPSGGAWIISYGTIVRAVERPGTADGWEIVERPSPWHGLMISDAEDILEEPSGDLWIATLAGVVHVPAEIRRAAPPIPRVELVDVLVDGEELDWRREIDLSYRRSRIELRFAGLSYRDPGLLRYQVRLRVDAPWRDAQGRPWFQFVDLQPGSYHAEVRASLDGRRWSEPPAGLSFKVLPPFWRTWWFTLLIVSTGAASAYSFYRYRLAQLLRLERMRTRIAADLHDDIGSSLSRIALQSEMIRRNEALRPRDTERLLSDIGESARALVDSMSDIVWSIDPKRDDLGSLVARVRHFALGILEPLHVALVMNAPEEAAGVRLAPGQRRHLYLIVKEAIANVAKHAECRSVWIGIQVQGGRLVVEIRDDGRGLAAAQSTSGIASRGGHGIPSMRARAGLVGGDLTITSSPGEGTVVRVASPIERGGA